MAVLSGVSYVDNVMDMVLISASHILLSLQRMVLGKCGQGLILARFLINFLIHLELYVTRVKYFPSFHMH